MGNYLLEVLKMLLVGKITEKKKICRFLKAVSSVLFHAAYKVAYIIAPVYELTGSGTLFAFVDNIAVYTAYICKAYNNTASVVVTKSSFTLYLSYNLGSIAVWIL